jgi:hypothetical protein
MLTWGFILLGIVIVYFINVWIEGDFELTWGQYVGSIFLGLLLGSFILLFGSMIFSLVLPQEYILESDNKLYALQDNNGIQGAFYLGSGYINSSLQYSYAIKNGEVIHIYHIDVDHSDLIFTKEKPHVVRYILDYKNKFLKNNMLLFENKYYYCQFYIPQGTIKSNYNVDLN